MKNQPEQDMKEAIKSFLKTYRLDSKINEVQVKDMWMKVMGTTMAKYTEEIKLKNGKLMVHILSAPLKNEIHYNKEKIIQRINDEFGETVIKELEVR